VPECVHFRSSAPAGQQCHAQTLISTSKPGDVPLRYSLAVLAVRDRALQMKELSQLAVLVVHPSPRTSTANPDKKGELCFST
jgi:hypothetical protein